MPDLSQHSILSPNALPPHPPSLYAAPPDNAPLSPLAAPAPSEASTSQNSLQTAAVPPVVDPTAWEDFAVFRETFLMYLTPPGYAAALRKAGEMLFTMILENYDPWPGWPESSTRTELRSAVADLRHLEGFFQSVGREHSVSSLARSDERLSRFAARQAIEVAKIAHRIEMKLAAEMEGE
jgi:hypothetical protein